MKLLQTFGVFFLLLAASCNSAGKDKVSDMEMPFLGNEKCPMSGEMIDEEAFLDYEGQRVYFCCDKCVNAASTDPAGALRDAYGSAMVVGNTMCPISGKAVSDSSATWQGHEVGLCCDDCAGAFNEDPAANTAKAMMK